MPGQSGSRRDWGWHRLTDEWAARVVAAAGVRPGELVVDIGAGRGALTAPLLDAGARVIAVEAHPGRASYLRERFAGRDVVVVTADALTVRLPRRPFRVVASPPYGITAPLLRMLLARGSALAAADLVLQRAAVRRQSDGHNRATERIGRDWVIAMGISLPRRAFAPPPRVDSAVLVARRRGRR
ncbi:MAG TPA: rRNA adenine N-6-methyltransferase family protein [Trebonia sp.]